MTETELQDEARRGFKAALANRGIKYCPRIYSIACTNGDIGTQSHNKQWVEATAAGFRKVGFECEVVESDCPHVSSYPMGRTYGREDSQGGFRV